MRKYLATCVVCAFLLFALGLVAQSESGQTSNMPSGTNSSQNPNSPAGDHQMGTEQSGNSGAQSGAAASSGKMAKTKTLEGCVLREETDYFLIPKSGNPVHLSSANSSELSSHVGHRVKVHGSETAAKMGTGSSNTAGLTGSATSETGQENESQSSSGTIGSSAGNTGSAAGTSSGSAGMTGQQDLRSAATQEIMVDRIQMISESCPSNWNPKWNQSGASSAPSNK